MIDNYILFNNIPEIDLHGEDRYSAIYLTGNFINDNKVLGNSLIKIVHGKGTGILKREIHSYLKTNKDVISFKSDIFNEGVTIVEIKSKD